MEDSLSYLGSLLRRYNRFPLPEGVRGNYHVQLKKLEKKSYKIYVSLICDEFQTKELKLNKRKAKICKCENFIMTAKVDI